MGNWLTFEIRQAESKFSWETPSVDDVKGRDCDGVGAAQRQGEMRIRTTSALEFPITR